MAINREISQFSNFVSVDDNTKKVSISTSFDIGGDSVISGIATAQKFIGDGSELRGLRSTELVSYASASDISNSALSISGISTYNEVGILTNSYSSLSDRFGSSVATSADGKIIIVGATQDEVSSSNGAVYVFDREGNTFNEVGILTGSYASDNSDYFGQSVATSADGKTIVVGAYLDETGSTSDTGVVYVYDREGNNFNEVGILTGSSGADGQDRFGYSVATSADGKTIIVGADQDETSGSGSYGLVYVYDREGNNFNEVGILTGSNATHATDQFGRSVATSADGKTIVVGAIGDETSGFTGYGLVYVFDREGNNFNQVGILTGSLASDTNDRFGGSVATSADGNKIIVGAYNDEINPSITGSGIVYVFDREGNNFNQVGILTGSTNTNAYFGWSVATSADGNTIIVGGYLDSVNGSNSGVAYVFNRQGNNFNRVNTLLGSNVANGDHFGYSVAISADSKTIIVGADNDEISSSGGGNQGLVYVFDQERETYVFSDTNGNIGIGSAQPTAKLDINGTLNVSGIATFQDNIGISSGKSIQHIAEPEFNDNAHKAILSYGSTESTPTGTGGDFYREYAFHHNAGAGTTGTYYQRVNNNIDYEIGIDYNKKFAIGNHNERPLNSDYTSFEVVQDGETKLYYNYIKKLETTGYGVSVTGGLNVSGIVTAQLFSGNGGSLTNVSAFEAYKSDISDRAFKTDEISGALSYAYNGQRVNSPSNHTFALKTVISKNGKVAFVSEYDDQSQQLNTGRIHIYERTGANFTSIGIVTQTSHSSPGVAETTTCFGPIVACNADASIFAVGSPQGNPNTSDYFSFWHSPSGPGQQSVHIFQRDGSTITNIGILTSPSLGPNSNGDDSFGGALAFSDDGSKLYVGSPSREENGPIDGAVFVYDKSGLTYNYVGIITHSLQFGSLFNGFGQELACSSDGNILFVGWPCAYRPDNPNDGGSTLSGVIEIYDRSGSTFNNVGIISTGHDSNGNPLGRGFGYEIACSDDGNYVYTTSFKMGNGPEDYNWGKLHLFKRESNTYSEVSSSTLETPVNNNNRLQWGLACDSSGSKVIAGEANVTSAGLGVTGYVHYYARVGDIITNIGHFGSGLSQINGYGTFGLDLDLDGSGEVGIIAAPYTAYSGDNSAVINGNALFIGQTRGTSVYSDIATGNIGIKSDAPKATLDVNGSIKQELHTPAMPVGRNDDIGEQWERVSQLHGGHMTSIINSITYCGDGIVLAGSGSYYGNVIRSTDYGKTWVEMETGVGETQANITAVVYCGKGIALAGSSYQSAGAGDIYRSTDYGLTWTKIYDSATLQEITALEYCGNGIVLAGSGNINTADEGDVYRSTDFGLTWTKIEMEPGVSSPQLESIDALCYIGNGIVLAGSGSNTGDGDVYRSTDFGQNWTKIEMGANLESIAAFAYCGGGVVVAGAGSSTDDGDVYRSTDFGQTWTKIEMGSSWEVILSLAYCDNGVVLAGTGSGTSGFENPNDGFVYKSVDYGQTWTQIVVDPNNLPEVIKSLCYLGNGIVLAGGGRTLMRGDIWRSDVGFSQGSTAQAIHHQHYTGYVGVGTADPVVKLDVAGFIRQELHTPAMPIGLNDDIAKAWTKVEVGTGLEQIPALVYCGHGIVLAGSGSTNTADDGDIYRSTDFGRTWIQIEMGSGLESILSLVYIGNGIVLAGSGSNTGDGDVYRSTDFGLNWTKVEMGAGLEQIPALAYCGDGIVLAGAGSDTGDGDVYRSTDYGQTWTKTYDGANYEIIYSITYCGDGLVLAGTGSDTQDGDILRSTDYGQTWILDNMHSSHQLEAIHTILYCGQGVILLGGGSDDDGVRGNGVIFRSQNYGETWVRKILHVDGSDQTDLESIHSLVYCDNGIVLAGAGSSTGDGDIYKSTDLGANWTKVEMGSGLESVLSLVYCGNGIVLAGSGSSTGDGDIYRSDVGFSPASTIQGIHHEHLTGNIGIGSTQPTATLDVNGTLNVSGISTFQDNITVGAGKSISWDTVDNFHITTSAGAGLVETSGELYFGTTHLYIQKPGGTTTMAEFIQDGAVKLNHNNITKLQTTASGIDVTGRVETDALNVSGISTFSGDLNIDKSDPTINLIDDTSDANNNNYEIANAGGYFWIRNTTDNNYLIRSTQNDNLELYGGGTKVLETNSNGIDVTGRVETDTLNVSGISTFNNDVSIGTGATVAFFDISAGRVGIGSTTPTAKLDVNGTLNVSGIATFHDDVRIGNNDSLYLGNGEFNIYGYDLSIYHQGGAVGSGIINNETGDLKIINDANDRDVSINADNGSGNTTPYFVAEGSTGEAILYHYGTQKLATKSDGVSITGGLNVSGVSTFQNLNIDNNSFPLVGILTGFNIDDGFGGSFATNVDGTSVVVGEKFASVNGTPSAGYAYVYDRSGNTYSQVGILTAGDDIEATSFFGDTVAMSRDGSLIMVSATYKDVGAISNAGKVYAFERSGNTFTRIGIITASDAATDYLFGDGQIEISDDKNYIAIGSPNTIIYGSDQLYIYKNTGGTFTEVGILTAGPTSSAFAESLAFTQNASRLFVGKVMDWNSPYGEVHIFDRSGDTFSKVGVVTAPSSADTNDRFGKRLAVTPDGQTLVISSSREDILSNDSGNVFIYNNTSGSQYSQIATLSSSNPRDEGFFGSDVSIDDTGSLIVVGAQLEHSSGINSTGAAYIFKRRENTFYEVETLTSSSPDSVNFFGRDVLISPDASSIFIGEYKGDIGGTDIGNVHIYDVGNSTSIFTTPDGGLSVSGPIEINNSHSIVSKTISHTSTAGISSTIDSFATSANDLAEYTIHVGYGNAIQAQKVLVMHDGTTAYSQEYAVMYNPSKIVTIEASISGNNVLLQATPETGISGITTYKIVRGGLV